MATRTRIAIFAGLVVAVAGFGLITVAWDGAASHDYIQAQFPYLLSGGVTGLALVIVGLAIVVVNQIKAEGDDRATQIDELVEAVNQLAARLGAGGAGMPPAPNERAGVQGPPQPPPRPAERPTYRPRPRGPETSHPGRPQY